MNCKLAKLDHSKFRDSFKNTFFYCPLFQGQPLCAACCFRLSQWLEYRQRATLTGEISPSNLKRDPDCWVYQLPEHLRPYNEAVKRLGYENVLKVCTTCKRKMPRPDEPPPQTAPPTEMTCIRRADV